MTDSEKSSPSIGETGANFPTIDVARIVDTGPFGYVTAGRSEIIDGINHTLTDWLGRSSETIIGHETIQDLLAPGDRIYYDTHIRPMLSMQGEVSEIAVQLVCADGRRLPALMNSMLRVDENGDQRVEAVVIDATERRRYEQELLHERKAAEDSEARLQLMYDVVSGLAGATSVATVVEIVTDRADRSIAGATCSVWLFDAKMRSVARANSVGDTQGFYSLPGAGPALAHLARGDLLVIEEAQKSAAEYPLLCQMLQDAGHTSAAVAPLLTDGVLHGVMNYGFEEPHLFGEAECRAVMSLAAQTEQALERARSLEAELRGRERLQSLFRFSTRLSGALTVDDVLQVIAGDSVDLLGATSVRLAVVAESRSSVRFVRVAGQDDDETMLKLDSNAVACEVIRTGEAVSLDSVDDLRDQFPDSPLLADDGIGRVLAVPLVRDDDVLGAWVLAYAEASPPDADDVTLLLLFAEQASQATGRAFFHQNEAAARARADVRLAISESLNAAVTTEDVAGAITIEGRKAFDASGLAVYMADLSRPDTLEMIAGVGLRATTSDKTTSVLPADFVMNALTSTRTPVYLEGPALEPLRSGFFAEQQWQAVVLVPMSVSGRLLGLVVVGFDDANVVTPGVRVALGGLTAEAGAALGRARRYELEHEVAVTLQKSLLPTDLPVLDGWTISARYEPGAEHLVVGGDLFDVISLEDGRLIVIVGDVVGHGLHAAASMGQLRSAARALGLVSPGPREIIQGLEAFARITPGSLCATIACITIEPNGDGLYACAGHPYPVLVGDRGEINLLKGGRSTLLGVSDQLPQVAKFHMDPGDCLVLYTDGVIEHDTQDLDHGIQRLQRALKEAKAEQAVIDAGEVVDSILDGASARDDIVVVCVTRVSAE